MRSWTSIKPLFAGLLLTVVLAADPAFGAGESTPYAGQQTRDIKALSPDDVADIVAGRGWGLAKAAELNGVPGPAHLLELADRIGLSSEQVDAISAVRAAMTADAVALGAELLERERALDRAFSDGAAMPDEVRAMTAAIGETLGALRAVHLNAHLTVRPLLTDAQVAAYNAARGYGRGDLSGHGHDRGHGHNNGHRH